MKYRKTLIGLVLILVLGATTAYFGLREGHHIPECSTHLNGIAKAIIAYQEDNGKPPSDLSVLCSPGTMPKAIFFCSADPKGWSVVKTSETFYTSYAYFPNAVGSGKSVMLYCPHHMRLFRCVTIAFGDGRARDYSVKEARQWLPDL